MHKSSLQIGLGKHKNVESDFYVLNINEVKFSKINQNNIISPRELACCVGGSNFNMDYCYIYGGKNNETI